MNGDFGARLLARDRACFRFWAPDVASVSVEIDDFGSFPMALGSDGVFEATVACGAGARYRYRLPTGAAVPDPASRAQAGDVHDSSVVVDPDSYQWQAPSWRGRPWHEAVIYELHAGVYGGFANIIADLPRLARIGFTAIELMPVADFPGLRNWGYDGVLPYAPDTSYGTPDQLKALVDAAHQHGLMIFLDVVYNHFGPDGDYLNSYASGFFRDDIHTPWGGAIDFRKIQVRRFFIENALYWLNDFRFDGLRFDAVHAINDSEFLVELAHEARHGVAHDRKIHLVLENENNDARLLNTSQDQRKFDAQWNDDWHHCVHVLLTGENEGYYRDFQHPAAQLARALAEGFVYQGDPSPHAEGKPRGTPSGQLPATCFVNCLQNHDQIGNRAMGDRLTTLARPEALRAAVLLLLMTPQIPLIFMGEESAASCPFLFFTDHHNELAEAVRQGRRKEFEHFAAFADPRQREKIPDPNLAATFEASVPRLPNDPSPQQAATIALYQQALRFRAEQIAPRLVGAIAIEAGTFGAKAVRARWRMGDGALLAIAANFGEQPETCPECGEIPMISSAVGGGAHDAVPGFTTCVWLDTA